MKRNEIIELTWRGHEPADSYVDVDLTAHVTGPDGQKMIKGFYAGDGQYKVRFLPEEVGEYTYEISGLLSASGTIRVDEVDTQHHGIVRASGTHLRHQDGTYFTGFGTTVYALAHQTDDLIDQTLDTLSRSPFNKVRMCVFPKHYHYNTNDPAHYPFQKDQTKDNWDVNHPDFAFWDAFEKRLYQLSALGIQVDLILFHPYDRWGFATMSRDDNLVYLDYLLRRLAAFPNIWWSLANEYDLCSAKSPDDWDTFGTYIQDNDPYDHLISNHNCFALFDHSKDYISHVSIQNRVMTRVPELQKRYHKPVCYDECCYEGNLNETWGNISGREMTRRFWQVTTIGGHCTHGETYLDPRKAQDDDAVVWWSKGGQLIGESPARIAFLKDLVDSFPGPLEYHLSGLAKYYLMTEAEFQQALLAEEEGMRDFLSHMQPMDAYETSCHLIPEYEYAGHVGEDIFLYYCDAYCFGRRIIELPPGHSYRIEAIDTWNMTRTLIATGARGSGSANQFEVFMPLPAREGMAILCTRETV